MSGGSIAAVVYWFDDAITDNSHVGFFFIQEIVCAAGYAWDNSVHACVAPPVCPRAEASIGDPCDAATGNEHHVEADFTGTGPFPLTFSRTYNSQFGANGRMGFNWTSNYGDPTAHNTLTVNVQVTPNVAHVPRPNGEMVSFRLLNGVWIPDANITDSLVQTSTGWTYTLRDGTVETYDNTIDPAGNSAGRLTAITNPAGLAQTLSYDPESGYLNSVADAFGHRLTFTYDASGRLSAMTDPNGGVTTYAYDDTNYAGNLSTVTYADGSVRSYKYNEAGLVAGRSRPHALTGIVDENNSRYATFGYDTLGRVVLNQLADVGNGGPQERFTLAYDSFMQTTVTDAANNKEVMAFSRNLGVNNLISRKNLSDNKTLTQSFDANNNRTCRKDEEGRVTTYTYNAANQKTSMTEGLGGSCAAPVTTSATRTTTYQYFSPTLNLPVRTQSPSVYPGSFKTVSIGYTGNLPTTITQTGYTPTGSSVSRTVTMTYNASGQVASINGPRTDVADVTTLAYYDCATGGACGQLKSVTNALGQTTTYDSYDANGRLLSTTDPNSLKTLYMYDARGRVTSITQTAPNGSNRVTQYGYDAAGNVVFTGLPSGLALTYTYNAANYLTRVVDSLGNRIDYAYDLKGNRTQTYTYDAAGTLARAVDLAYNARNRVSQINAGGSITKQVWDAIGNLTAITDPNTVAANGTASTTNSHDSLNRLWNTIDLLSGNTQYAYDVNDRMSSVQAPNGATTQYQYDDLGNLLTETSPDRGTLTYTYDAAGNVKTLTDAHGITVTYTYDALNRLTSTSYPDVSENVTYTYDAGTGCTYGVGRLCTVVDAAGSSSYAYDVFGNLVTDTRTEINIVYTTRYTYDAGNRVTSITYPNGRQVSYTRDAKGNVQAASMTLGGVTTPLITSASYRPDGLPTSRAFGDGLTDTRVYDTQGRLRELYLGSADTRLYAYDANGNLTSLQSLPEVDSWSYDLLNRLIQEDRNPGMLLTTQWTYDANGNRKTQNAGTYSYLVGSNRLTNTPNGGITLDVAGNTTSDGFGRNFSYNQAGELSAVPSNGASFAYNHQRQRTRKIVGPEATVYHYDLNGNLLAETKADGNLIRDYIWADGTPIAQVTVIPGQSDPRPLPGTHGNVQGQGQGSTKGQGAANVLAHRPELPTSASRPGATGTTSTASTVVLTYLHTDHLNTPRLATNPQGQVVWRWEATAFGETAPNEDPGNTGITTTVNLRYPGQYYDAETGLFYNWNRYYDPKLGRYITSDPIGLRGGRNTYTYVDANPVNDFDITGECPGIIRTRWYLSQVETQTTSFAIFQTQSQSQYFGVLTGMKGSCDCNGMIYCTYHMFFNQLNRNRERRPKDPWGPWAPWGGIGPPVNLGFITLPYDCKENRFLTEFYDGDTHKFR